MKTCINTARQGELRFERLPDDFKIEEFRKSLPRVKRRVVVGHSETGHDHVMLGEKTNLYQIFGLAPNDRGMSLVLVVEEPDVLLHEREEHQHERLAFPPGAYRVRSGREYIPGAGKLGRAKMFRPTQD